MKEFYDVISIGSSPKIFMKIVEYAKNGKSILILDSTNQLGGNWKTTKFAGYDNVEYGCFVIPNNKQDYEYLIDNMNIDMPVTKNQPYTLYNNKKYPMNSVLLYALLDYRKDNSIKNLLNIIPSFFIEKWKIYKNDYITKYFKYGIRELLDSYTMIIERYNISVYKNEIVKDIYVDFDNKCVEVKTNQYKIKTNQLLIGAGISIDKIRTSKFNFFINRNRNVLSLFTFLLVKVKIKNKLDFTYVDLTHLSNNNFKDEQLDKIDFYQETRTSYDKYKIVWRVTNITDYADGDKDGYALLSIDTNSWLPKDKHNNEMVNVMIDILKSVSLIDINDKVIKYEWHTNEANTIGKLETLVSEYCNPYISSTNSLFFTRNPR